MDHSDQIPTPERWPSGGAPTTDAPPPPSGEPEPGVSDASAMHSSLTSGFLAELAKAMHAAADQERERIATIAADDAAAHVVRAQARAAVEAEELRRFADEDLRQINEWSAAEIKRIRSEAARRADERRAALAEYIRQHEAIIETEIQGVDGAMAEYRGRLQQFFTELTASTDPAEIVRRAGTLPPPPDLDDVRASARAAAVGRIAQAASDDDPVREPEASMDEPAIAEATDWAAPTDDAPADDAGEAGSPDVESSDVESPLIGVMDPAAARQSGTPDVLMDVDSTAEASGEAATAGEPPDETGAEGTGVEGTEADGSEADGSDPYPQPVATAAGASTEPGPAVRLIRTIATLMGPSAPVDRRTYDAVEHKAPDKAL